MTDIVINLERGPDGQPAGLLRTATGETVPFTGWLALVRLLEDELETAGSPAHDAGNALAGDPSSAD
jgi:hypothetical protein